MAGGKAKVRKVAGAPERGAAAHAAGKRSTAMAAPSGLRARLPGKRLGKPRPKVADPSTPLRCKTWRAEAILRMLENNLHNAEDPDSLVVYGGTGKAARNPKALAGIRKALQALGQEETLLVQSGKPVAVFETWEQAPRVLIANSHLVPKWSDWDHFRKLEADGLTMYGQMTAGSWCYIGTQGIIQGTYETFAAAARTHFGGDLRGRIVLTGGLGGMGGAQPLAVTMNGGVCLAVEVDEARARRRLEAGFLDAIAHDVDLARQMVEDAARSRTAISVGLVGNCAEVLPRLLAGGFRPDLVTDQTSAHDALHGYVPPGMDLEAAARLRKQDPHAYQQRALAGMARHVEAMVGFAKAGAHVFDYGNNIREGARLGGLARETAFSFPGFVPAYIRPMFCEGRGPFRWIALTGNVQDIRETEDLVLRMFPKNRTLTDWIRLARERLPVEGLPARVCWLGMGERDRFAVAMNELVRKGVVGPIAVTRDHLDSGSVASPYRETEGMKDGSDAIADWPILNAMVNIAAGADSVHLHNGGGVGIGYSTHAGMVVVLDGSKLAEEKAKRVFRSDPGMGVVRHADAGYTLARRVAKRERLRTPLV
ncbi:MAG TPA: urocanate hydratase [Candidatus Thermoplasmatota archaeon]|nr:urocanate hydratase [Candidatus Thermoplasmatota archaeon]